MKLIRYRGAGGDVRVGLIRDGQLFDLTAVDPLTFGSIAAWLRHPRPVDAVRAAAERAGAAVARWDDATPAVDVLAPLDLQEVWAAGVTYLRSKQARMEESEQGGSFYDLVYEADRPELFFKATPSRVVGPGESIRIRGDAAWSVPEPEVALVVSASMQIVGYTIGNDVSSRDIEGQNPLYLPQAKCYRQCCALGPAILIEERDAAEADHREFDLGVTIDRGEQRVFEGQTSTARMKRRFGELVEYLGRDNVFPDGVFLLTGTGIVPPDDFTLEPGDAVTIAVPEIGGLHNTVVRG